MTDSGTSAWWHYPMVRVWLVFGALLVLVGLVSLLLAPLLVPIVLSFVLYALLEPLSGAMYRRGLNHSTAALVVLALLVVVIAAMLSWVVPQFAAEFARIQARLGLLWNNLGELTAEASALLETTAGVGLDADTLVDRAATHGNELAGRLLVAGPGLVLSTVLTLMLLPVFTFFLIRDWKGLRSHLLDMLPNHAYELGWLIYYRVAHQLQSYVRGVMIQSVIMALVTGTGFWLLGIESALLLGVLAGILNLIPYVGPLLAMVPPAVIVLGDPDMAVILVFYAALVVLTGQLVDNLLVVPSVIAHSVNLHPLIVITGIIVFGNLFGLLGMILAIPALSTANIVLRALYHGMRPYTSAREVSPGSADVS